MTSPLGFAVHGGTARRRNGYCVVLKTETRIWSNKALEKTHLQVFLSSIKVIAMQGRKAKRKNVVTASKQEYSDKVSNKRIKSARKMKTATPDLPGICIRLVL